MWVSKMPLSVVACWTAHGKYAQKLLTDLFANYTSALRPVEDTNNILNVTLQVTLSQIIDMVKQCKVCAFTTQWYSITNRKKFVSNATSSGHKRHYNNRLQAQLENLTKENEFFKTYVFFFCLFVLGIFLVSEGVATSYHFQFPILFQDERNQILTAYLWIRQVWVDAYLKWNKDEYDGLDTIRIPSSYVWRPDIVLYNK